MRMLPVLFLSSLAACGQQLTGESKGSKGAASVAQDDDSQTGDARPRKKKSTKPDKTTRKPAADDVAVAAPSPDAADQPAASAEPALPASTLPWDGETITGTASLNLMPTE